MDEREFDYINIVPMVDVMLVLLTIVLTTSTFIARGIIPVDLPKASHHNTEKRLEALTIEIDKSGMVYLNSDHISLAGLQDRLRPIDRSTPVLIRADQSIPLQQFVDVLSAIKGNGFSHVSIQTEGKKS
ncbi:MAG: biopolymer transporter ExbD [Dissulfurispiraceae bacterium]|jgi:biopolymer transport protein ExbD|nr:biopolymer transporter ExbD [Dissulfurispiraceae bacterium]